MGERSVEGREKCEREREVWMGERSVKERDGR